MAADTSLLRTTESPTVESVNLGTPRTVEWHGREFTTSIFKVPTAERVAVSGVNIAGDAQADLTVHGGTFKAVYAYGRDDYDWWTRELGYKLAPGTFGENLTLTGIHVSRALIGERWKIGTTVLEVVQPRLPCSKLAMRMDDAHFVRRFGDADRPGAYLSIVEEGHLAAGDTVEIVYRPDHEITVSEMSRIYLRDHDGAHRLREVPNLPPDWHEWIDQRSQAAIV